MIAIGKLHTYYMLRGIRSMPLANDSSGGGGLEVRVSSILNSLSLCTRAWGNVVFIFCARVDRLSRWRLEPRPLLLLTLTPSSPDSRFTQYVLQSLREVTEFE